MYWKPLFLYFPCVFILFHTFLYLFILYFRFSTLSSKKYKNTKEKYKKLPRKYKILKKSVKSRFWVSSSAQNDIILHRALHWPPDLQAVMLIDRIHGTGLRLIVLNVGVHPNLITKPCPDFDDL